MRKNIFVLLVLAFALFSCDNGGVETEQNPYPDGVYPFEVSNITHTEEDLPPRKYVITWDNPTDKDFSSIEYDMFAISSLGNAFLISGEYAAEFPDISNRYDLGINSLTFITTQQLKKYLVVRCIDRFGNISGGVRHNLYDN